ncbi:uncharacterized protein LOC115241844 [Formica exsecta]|uniref:uncharacterized protein LOC115241844 n=1 Tax=Formica exsecta TaxID=72781 RepID=UPI001143E261|nr:uncharacterized protein LOC115241844 [Formica exsecta]
MIASSVPPLPCESPDSDMEAEPTQEKSLTSQSNQENSVDNEPSSSASKISRDASDQSYTSFSTLKRQSRNTQDEENSVPKKLNASKQIPDAVLANRYPKFSQGPYEIVVTSIGSVNSSIHPLIVGRLLSSTLKKDITEIKKLGFSKVSVQFKLREAANNIINNPILNSNNLIAYIPSYRVSRQGVIRNIPLDLAENTIKEEIDSSVGIIFVRRLSRKIIDPSTRSVSYSPSKFIAITFEGQTVPQFLYLYMVRPWFLKLGLDREEIVTACRIRSNHYNLHASLYRCNIISSPACECGHPSQDINHTLWICPRHQDHRPYLLKKLEEKSKKPPPFDAFELLSIPSAGIISCLASFFKKCNLNI